MTQPTTPIRLFIAYAHEDEDLRDKLGAHLAVLRNTGLIAAWHDRKIVPGTDWNQEISKNLDRANVVLLLISSDFLNSDYCMNVEFQHALARQENDNARVIPVIMRPTLWTLDDRLAALQALPKDGKSVAEWDDEDAAMMNVAEGIRHTVLALQGVNGQRGTMHSTGEASRGRAGSGRRRAVARSRGGAFRFIKRLIVLLLLGVLGLVVGAGLGLGAGWIGVKTFLADAYAPDVLFPSTLGGALFGLGLVLFLTLRARDGGAAEKALQRAVGTSRPGMPGSGEASGLSEAERWKQTARVQYERKELYKAAFLGTRRRSARRRAVVLVALLLAAWHFITSLAASGAVSMDSEVWYLRYAQSLLLFIGVVLIVAFVSLRFRKRLGPRYRFASAVLIGGIGPLLCGLLFFLQMSPETLMFIKAASEDVNIFVVPGLQELGVSESSPLHVPFLTFLAVQRVLVLPLIGLLTACTLVVVLPSPREAPDDGDEHRGEVRVTPAVQVPPPPTGAVRASPVDSDTAVLPSE